MDPEKLGDSSKETGITPEDKAWQEAAKNIEAAGAPKEKEGLFGRIREKVNSKMNEDRLPSAEYRSTVGVYGGKIEYDQEGRMVLDRRGIVSKIDKTGDAILRTVDEHVVKEPGKLLRMHPKAALKFLFNPGTKRYRGSNEEVLENAERLGLSEYYGPHENGIEIKKPEVFTHGVHLQDVYNADLIGSEKLEAVNRFQALAEAAKYARDLHDNHGAVGELNMFHFLFQKDEGGKVSDPILYMPDIVWNKNKVTSEKDKKTTDMLDFLSSVFVAELRRSQNSEDVDRALDTVVSNYGDKDIISLVEAFIKRGRLTLQGDTEVVNLPDTVTKKVRGIFGQHNKARLGSKTEIEGEMKQNIIDACERFLTEPKE